MKTTHSLSLGTFSGTILSIIPNLSSGDLFKTAILAAVGAAVSYIVSFILKQLFRKYEK